MSAPKPVAWRLWTSWPGWSGKPGQKTRSHLRVVAQERRDRARVLLVPRHAQVQRLRPAQDEPRVEGREDRARRVLHVPQPLARGPRRFTTATPPTLSECPFRNFVVECTTMSAPSASGRWKNGLMKVLSTTRTRALAVGEPPPGAAMSQTFISGLVGRLDPQQVEAARPRLEGRGVARVEERELDAVLREDLREEPVGAAVDVVRHHDALARPSRA